MANLLLKYNEAAVASEHPTLDDTLNRAFLVEHVNDGTHGANAARLAGEIAPYGAETPPSGWLECNGATVSRTTYAALFAAIGTTWGSGDGATTFHLPDLRGRFLRGFDHAVGRDPDKAARTACNSGGNTGDHVGSVQTENVGPHFHPGKLSVINLQGDRHGEYVAREGDGTPGYWWAQNIAANFGSETRPINAGVMFIVKY